MLRSRAKKMKRDDEDEDMEEEAEDDGDDVDERVLFFIPSEDIDIEVLVFYLKRFLGQDSDADPGNHPRNRNANGYFVKSRLGLSALMVKDLKSDSRDWKEERRRKRSERGYAESETAARRLRNGASAQPTIPQKTRDLAAQRGQSLQPQGQSMAQSTNTPSSTNRHQVQQDTTMQPSSMAPTFYQQESIHRHQSTYSGQPNFAYATPTATQSRSPAINLSVNMNAASFSQGNPQRHQSPQQANVLPSIEGQYQTPAPAYTEEEDSKAGQPSTTGAHGWSIYPTAGPRHNR